eukprot:TRINITY_DN6590_c0_g1_i8.p1 TRINITY_DN6590_c0_g1~~TRINITY_DN6590_c0_g1_i8.p1  ORF type:complete len:348 (+),score=83.99 TRINITY_DN6590_c0_g1_i8:1347-2390(+)
MVITSVKDTHSQGVVGGIELPVDMETLFSKYLDFLGVPRRYFFELLSFFCTDEQQRQQLKFLSSKEGYQTLYEYNHRARRSYFDVLRDFPSASVPKEYILDFFSTLKPRPFSISSSYMAHKDEIHVSVVVVRYKSSINRIKQGICSTWLANLTPLSSAEKQHEEDEKKENTTSLPLIPLWVKQGTIRFPEDPLIPIVMVGPGTGCAIFRAFLQYRRCCLKEGKKLGVSILFFGCRKRNCDFLYSEEWKQFQEEGVLTHFHVAFSRDQPQKIYVQDLMVREESRKQIWSCVTAGGCFFISGRSDNMPKQVRQALLSILHSEGNFTVEQAQKYWISMEQQNRFMTETWY